MTKIRTALAGALCCAALAAPLAAEPLELIYGGYMPPQSFILTEGVAPANAEMGDAVKFDIVAGGQLWDAAGALKGIGSGMADAGSLVNSYSRTELKHAALTTDLTFTSSHALIADAAALETYFLDCPECLGDFKKANTVFLSGSTASGYSLMCRDQVTDIASVAGKKIRTAGAMGRLASAMGGTPVGMSTSDMVEGLSRGQLDCIMGPAAWLSSYPIQDEVKSVYNFNLGAFNSFAILVMNRDTWAGLDDTQRAAVWNEAPAIGARATINGYIGSYLDAVELAESKGITVTGPGEDMAAMARDYRGAEAESVIEAAQKAGVENADHIVNAFLKNLDKWEKIIADAGLTDVTAHPGIDRETLAKAVPVYTELLREHIYSKVDPGAL